MGVVRSNIKMNKSEFVKQIQSANRASTTAFNACRKAAGVLVEEQNTAEKHADEYKRLMKLAKDTVAENSIALVHPADVYKYIGQNLLTMMLPTMEIEIQKGKEKLLIPAEDLSTAREVREASKQIREAVGLTDGRANNRGKKTAAPKTDKKPSVVTDVLGSLPAMLKSAKTRAAIFKLIEAEGFKITK